jgi:hypothetical protein
MAYKTKELEKQALEAIKEHGLVFIEEIVAFLPCSKPTFYEHGLNELDSIVQAIGLNHESKRRERKTIKGLEKVENKFKKGSGYVYVIKCDGWNYYKIGISKSTPRNRLSNLQSGCPFNLDYITIVHCAHYSLVESEVHKMLRSKNIRGEWFELNPSELIDVIEFLNQSASKQLTLF